MILLARLLSLFALFSLPLSPFQRCSLLLVSSGATGFVEEEQVAEEEKGAVQNEATVPSGFVFAGTQ
jgi:hypothetical protein